MSSSVASSSKVPLIVFWFRRDLRLVDNRGLSEAQKISQKAGLPVLPLFIFDKDILDALEDRDDKRVEFIHRTVKDLDATLRKEGSGLCVEYGRPLEVFASLLKRFEIRAVYVNRDYEPAAIERDRAVENFLAERGSEFKSFKDQVVFENREVAKDDGEPYTVFTPYSRKWKARLASDVSVLRACRVSHGSFLKWSSQNVPTLDSMGFESTETTFPPKAVDKDLLSKYAEQRNFPAVRGTSRLGLHLRFGTVSARHLVALAREQSESWLNELIWREFFMQILVNFPHVVKGPFRPEYQKIKWRNDRGDFEKWCRGMTGYPIVDAGMRELNATGFMHNRVRMIAASFLVKHLLIDWRWGEAYFARKLLDFELASNNGNWQWVAGCGCDAAPYFRVFNPELQLKKFDPQVRYVHQWIPELDTEKYPEPMVDPVTARVRALRAYDVGLGKKAPKADK